VSEPMSTAAVVAGQIGRLRARLKEIRAEIDAQKSHIGPFHEFSANQTALVHQVKTSANHMRMARSAVHEVWDDAAGDTYGTAVDRSSRSMEAFAEAIQGANPGQLLQNAIGDIATKANAIAGLAVRFERVAAQLQAAAEKPGAQINLRPLVQIVEDADNLRRELDNFLRDVANQLHSIAGNMPDWAGPEGGGNPGVATRTTLPSTTSTPSGPIGGTPSDVSQMPQERDGRLAQREMAPIGETGTNSATESTGTTDAIGSAVDSSLADGTGDLGAGGVDGLGGMNGGLDGAQNGAENGALMPVRPVPGAIPGLNNKGITPGAGRNPFPGKLPDIARGLGDRNDVGGMGVPPALSGAGGGGGVIGGLGDIPGVHGPPTLQAADVPADPELPGVAQLSGGSETPQDPSGVLGGPGDGDPTGQQAIPPMVPPMGGMGGAGAMGSALAGRGGAKPGDGTGDGNPHRKRPVKNVPGVPQRLRGRAGMLDSTPAFLATSARKAKEEPAVPTSELLDEELWQVENEPAQQKRKFVTG